MGDSYRPRRARESAPSLSDRMTFTAGNGDSYRPNNGAPGYRFDNAADSYRPGDPGPQQSRAGNRAEFTFESSHAAPQFPPTGPANAGSRRNPRFNQQRDRNRAQYADSHRGRRGNGRGGFRKAAPHERALLRQRDDGSPERIMGVSDGPNRFLNPEDLSDDSEQDMECETDDSDARHNKKPALADRASRADGDSVPRWSNPDPYTVLPPPDETTGKKTDFVKLIRKAKNQEAEKVAADGAVAANDDFISFDLDEAPIPDVSRIAPRKPVPETIIITDDDEDHGHEVRQLHSGPSTLPRLQGSMNDIGPITLPEGSRRVPELTAVAQRPRQSLKRRRPSDGPAILPEWRPTSNPTPWVPRSGRHPYAHVAREPAKWLHNEILDFHNFVMPRQSDHDIRNDLVDRMDDFMNHCGLIREPGRILCFGSFPAGMYLPTADMDLVYTSEEHFNGGPPLRALEGRNVKSLLFKIAHKLVQTRMTQAHPTVITKAKVPIIKFVDDVTGLEVDVSFENLGGIRAQATFKAWKEDFSDLPYLVSLVKQYLCMRGANQVHTGGIGGFSIICLIVSYLQNTPKTENLGECFLGLLKHYGHDFDLATKRIQMCPGAIVNKTEFGIDGREEKLDGLSIQDPNRPDNNLTGGSSKAKDVFMGFAAAYETLQDRMAAAANGQDIGDSILGYVLGGNYQSYFEQRRIMDNLYRE
ncbi:hypothetical protein IQ07DRAFT_649949 [Pyrenochaeta sp. DS3sAY3a]|nr:hypothetical protein IQ07DRAFT_649949 [Pyrenochaeta sp. DS3sAY3a]